MNNFSNPKFIIAIAIYAILEGLFFVYMAMQHSDTFTKYLPVIAGVSVIPIFLILMIFGKKRG